MVGDANHLESMVFNLLDNAIKYSKTAPIVTVRLSKMPDLIVLTIEDHGIGITKEDQHRIFEKFFRVSHGNVHDVKGFGLGLSYVKEIVTLHGGTIKLKSEPGAGSTFTVFLPFKRGLI
jgi:two-component system phosphate regulon sensor histidine kinase PhoR